MGPNQYANIFVLRVVLCLKNITISTLLPIHRSLKLYPFAIQMSRNKLTSFLQYWQNSHLSYQIELQAPVVYGCTEIF